MEQDEIERERVRKLKEDAMKNIKEGLEKQRIKHVKVNKFLVSSKEFETIKVKEDINNFEKKH